MTRMNERDAYALMRDTGDEQNDAMHEKLERELAMLDREAERRRNAEPGLGHWVLLAIGIAGILLAVALMLWGTQWPKW